ncbi:MAG: hypothetical protein HXY40_03035 [Chloroflexi bacterium]|nr:hypothetical protein [Chloroflexota bacterium]
MSRIHWAAVFCTVVICLLALAHAADAPAADAALWQQPIATQEAQQISTLPPTWTPTSAPSATPAPSATAGPTQPATALGEALPVLINARLDLETLANAQLNGQRPPGWNGSQDFNDPQIPLLIRLDLELLVGNLLGADQRPAGWFGPVASSLYAIARDIRHDLELLADAVVQPGVRPAGWVGDDPLMRCTRATQALVSLLERSFRGSGGFTIQADPNSPDFCAQVELEASRFTEVNLLGGSSSGGLNAPSAQASGTITPLGSFTVAFLDRDARQRVGVIPRDTPLTVVARSYTQYSAMILVQAAGFQVFVDYTSTTLTPEQFETLPNIDGVTFEPFCDADWCSSG